MKKCSNCNISYADDKKFCKNCGSSLVQQYNFDPKELAKKTVLEEKLKADPLNEELLLEYSQFLFKNSLFKESIPNLLKILVINESSDQARELLFFAYVKLNMIDEASEIAKQLQAKKTKDIPFLEGLAIIETQLGNKDKAIEYYEAILKIQPANEKALNDKAILHLENKELEDAVETFKQLYIEGNRDRTTIIYFGIGKCLSGNFEEAIEVLKPCLEDKSTALSDLQNQRGFLYLVYSLCKTQNPVNVINEWFNLLDFEIIEDSLLPVDEETLAKSVLEIEKIYFSIDNQKYNLDNINSFIEEYINKPSPCFTAHTSEIQAEIWANLSKRYKELGLYFNSQASLKKATELSPENAEYKKKLNDVTSQYDKHKRKQKRKKLTIIGSLISLLVIIVVAVIFFNRHKENKAWEVAKQENTYRSYGDYRRKFPDGRFSEDAAFLQEEIFWQGTQSKNTIDGYIRYSQLFPDGKYASNAKLKIDSMRNIGSLVTREKVVFEIYKELNDEIPGKFPEASIRILTESDLRGMNKNDLRIMRNEIFARHGYIFNTAEMKAYFSGQNWYRPRYSDVNRFLSDVEKRNIEKIRSFE